MKKFDIFGEIWQCSDYLIARHEQNGCPDYPRMDTGEFPIRYPVRGTFQRSRDLKLFSAYRVASDFWPRTERLDILDPEKELVHIDLLRCRGDFRRPENQALGISYEDFAEGYYNKAIDFALEHPGRVILCVIGEVDSGCNWPKEYFRSKDEAYDFFKQSCFNYTGMYSDVGRFFKVLEKRNLTIQQINAMIHGACRFAIPYYFEWGYPNVEIERGIGVSVNMQISVGMIRGAWKQYGRKAKWGIDISTHDLHYNQCTWYNTKGIRIGGISEDLTERHWMHSFFAGADYILCEGSDYTHWVFQKDGSFTLSELGKRALKFADFTLRSNVDRGTPVVTGAVMIDYKNGYEQGGQLPPHVWGNHLPVTFSDLNIGHFYSVFYPGHGNTRGCDRVFSPETGDDTRQHYREALERGEDRRYQETGYFTVTPYGDALDTVWDNAPAEVLREYPVLMTAGDVKLPENILETYVAHGGTLMTSIDKLTESMKEKLGITMVTPLLSDWDYDVISLCDKSAQSDGMRYYYSRISCPNAEILAENHAKVPIVYSIPSGKGKVICCMIPLGQEMGGTQLIPVWGVLMGREVKSYLPVKFDAGNKLSISINRTEDGGLVLELINPFRTVWNETIEFKENASSAEELYPGKNIAEIKNNRLELQIQPFATQIIRVK